MSTSSEAMQVFYRSELDYLKAFMGMKEEDDFFHFNLTSSMDLLTINCSYEQLTNSIVIFPPFMLPPVYEANMHPAMKYGMLMSSIGHEITHSVDASGARIDENDEHAFEKERVNGVMMNMDRWYELFNVQWGDFLYLKSENRTHIW